MSCYDELRKLEDEGVDLIDVLGQDRHLSSPEELQALVQRLSHCTENLYGELLYLLTLRRYSADQAKELWEAIVDHKEVMSNALGRSVGIRVAALDYLTNEANLVYGVRLLAKPEFESIHSYVNIDEVTAVYNRRYFHEILRMEFHRARRYEGPLSLLILDVDGFKAVNDHFGHLEGDILLRKVGRLLKGSTRHADSVCRYGGDEFAIVLPQTAIADAQSLAERMRKAVAELSFAERDETDAGEPSSLWSSALLDVIGVGGSRGLGSERGTEDGAGAGDNGADKANDQITISIGGAAYPDHCEELEELIALADQMCFRAKTAGKDRVCMCDESIPGTG